MPQQIVAGYFTYPNLPPLIAGEYTCSHGTAPGTIVLRTHPAKLPPTKFGDVRIGDGRKELRLRDCKLLKLTAERDDDGEEWQIELEDARWMWRGGKLNGMHNQLDPHGKLIPKMVRSPTELANLCLDEMQGFKLRFVDMPDGIDTTFALTQTPDFLPVGVNFPLIGINPPVNWYAENPAAALAALADLCGRRVVFDPINERVLIVRPGIGKDLPDGHIANFTPSLTAPETPDAVEIVGDPTRYETMFELQAVGLEWDGSIRPINELSYAPRVPGRIHEVVYGVALVVEGAKYGVSITTGPGRSSGRWYTAEPGDDIDDILLGLKAVLENGGAFFNLNTFLEFEIVDGLLYISGLQEGRVFDVVTYESLGYDSVSIYQQGAKESRSWDFSPPPLYPNVEPTERLTRLQAMQLAQRSIWRMYRITGRDATTLKAPIQVPKYGPVVRQDIVLLDELCEQVVPEAGDKRVRDRDNNPLIKNLYNGYSRSKPAEVYGSVAQSCINNGEYWWIGDGLANDGAKIGAAAIPGAGAPSVRVMSVTVTRATPDAGEEYELIFEIPNTDKPGSEYYEIGITTVLGTDVLTIAAALKTAIDSDANVAAAVATELEDAKIILTAKNPKTLFNTFASKNSAYLAVTTVNSGTGAAAVPPPAPNSPPVSPSQQMTPVGKGKGTGFNTDPSDRVYVDFTVDPTWQMITFSSPVWYADAGGAHKEPKLFLRAACNVRNAITQQLEAYSEKRVFRPGKNVLTVRRPDVQLNLIGDYRIGEKKPEAGALVDQVQYIWKLINSRLLEQDAVIRARYYLNAEILQFQVKGGVTIEYNGIEPIQMDGKTAQVSYKVVGGQGTMTTASSNMEHSTWLPPYPARRRAENLAAVARNGGAGGGGRADNPATGSRNPRPPGAS